MKLKLKRIDFDAGRPISFLNEETAKNLDIHPGDRIELVNNGNSAIVVVDTMKSLIEKDEIAISEEVNEIFNLRPGTLIEIKSLYSPKSAKLIAKKMSGSKLSKTEIYTIIKDIASNALSEAEIAYFILSVYERGMSSQETLDLTESMCETGQILKWNKNWKVADKHSIGGIPGNRTTPIVVSICAAAGIKMPKTSSRAITSPAGTADTIESLAKVDFQIPDLKKIVAKTGACFVWGGSLGLAPADDKLIRVERILNLDPESQLLASIMSKKLAAGSKYILIDIPFGEGAKVSKKEAEKLREKFLRIAKYFKLNLKVILTDGTQPIGNGIGPTLEMIDVLAVLERENPPKDLENKSLLLAGEILELTGKAKKGLGIMRAEEILNSKKAFRKFNEIIDAQGRKKGALKLSKFKRKVLAKASGKIINIDNKIINHIGRILGCPADKGSGIYLHKKRYETVKKGDSILTLYSESNKKILDALNHISTENPIKIV